MMLTHLKTAVVPQTGLNGKKIIRAGYVDVKGSSFASRFTRQWLSLTEDELFFFKDSSLAPYDSIRCRDMSTTPTNTRRHSITLHTKHKKLFLSFKSAMELKDWTHDFWICNRPVIVIGNEPYDYEKTLTSDDMYKNHSPLFDEPPHTFPVLSKSVSNLHVYLDKPLPSVSGSSSHNSSFSRLDLFNWSARHRDSRSDVSTVLTDGEMPLFIDTELSPVPTDFATSPVFEIQALRDISSAVELLDENSVTTVSFVDSCRGKWSDGVRSKIVAIKSLRSLHGEYNRVQVEQRLLKHLERRRMTRHRNVLNLIGYIRDPAGCLSMVTPWSYNGNLADYLAGKGSGSSMLLRLRLLRQAAAGLQYLHDFEPPIVHGDVKAANILINDEGEAVVSHMGIAPLIRETASNNSNSSGSRLSFASPLFSELHRWMAFELLRSDLDDAALPSSLSRRSKVQMLPPCDIWSYGSTVLEVMTGNIPYHYHSDTTQVLHDIKQGIKPRIDTVGRVVSPPLVNFIQSCWTEDTESRPSATAITQTMTRIYEQS